jgi:hypothetical protein
MEANRRQTQNQPGLAVEQADAKNDSAQTEMDAQPPAVTAVTTSEKSVVIIATGNFQIGLLR